MGYAARYSNDIERDIERGYSFSGWMVSAQPTLENLVKELADISLIEWEQLEKMEDGHKEAAEILEDAGISYAFSSELNGFLPIERGLCAFYAEDEDEAIECALADERFKGLDLFVFEAQDLGEDRNDAQIYGLACRIVKPVSPARKVN